LRTLRKLDERLWFTYKGFYGPRSFLIKHKAPIDRLFNLATIDSYKNIAEASGFKLQPTNQKMLKIQYSEDKSEKREILFGLTR
jgi:hypothetical protein